MNSTSSENRLKLVRENLARNLIQYKKLNHTRQYLKLVIIRRTVEFLFSTLLLWSANQFIFAFAGTHPLYPATGVALSLIFLRGSRVVFGIFAGTLLSYLCNHYPMLFALSHSLFFSTIILGIRFCSLRFIGAIQPLHSFSEFWKWFICCMIWTAILSANTFNFQYALLDWVANLNGILFITPLSLFFNQHLAATFFQRSFKPWLLWSFLILVMPIGMMALPEYGILMALGTGLALLIYASIFGPIPTSFTLLGMAMIYLCFTWPGMSDVKTLTLLTILTINAWCSLGLSILLRKFTSQRY